ncbi:hypothetical protein ACU6U9_10010 [Pseudomonas sp. HK3]|jgi:hypothetical protein
MTFVVRSALLLILSGLFSIHSHANSALLNHAQAAFQAMSALYMKALSEGSPKYQSDLDKYKAQAVESLRVLQQQDAILGGEWMNRWLSIADNLKAEYSPEYDWDVESATRRDARSYLSDLYALITTDPVLQESSNQSLLAQVEVQAITARFFDVSSTYNGTNSLAPYDADKLKPKVASEQFKARLDRLAQSLGQASAKRVLSAKAKWEFVENSVVNYSDQSAYFLVYATKNKISKVLQNVQTSLAVSAI